MGDYMFCTHAGYLKISLGFREFVTQEQEYRACDTITDLPSQLPVQKELQTEMHSYN